MDTTKTCSCCQQPLPPDAPGGLCPQCLMQAGLGTGVDAGPDTQADSPRHSFVAPTPEELARFFPQLEILELLGRGGMGAVYKARQKQLDRFVAVKILPPGIGDDPAFAERFTREAKALAKLNHPHIVTLYEFGQTDGLFYFIMEFVDGLNLRQLLEAGRIAPREALAIVPQICDALQYAHDASIVHRDIKPENILLDRQGRVKVADFGLARIVAAVCDRRTLSPQGMSRPEAPSTADLTEAGKVMGTPQYMAPEQRDHPSEVDHRADIYSLGVVFYQMLTGELPAGKTFEPPSSRMRGLVVDVRLDEVVLRALEKEPERRYQQASILKTRVETILTTPPQAGTRGASGTPANWRVIVGACNGQRVINWHGVVVVFPLAFGVGLAGEMVLGLLISSEWTRANVPFFLAWAMAAAGLLLLSVIYQGFRMPFDALPPLDRTGRRAIATPSSSQDTRSRLPRVAIVWVAAVAMLALCATGIIRWAQRPRPQGDFVSRESSDGRYSASAGTLHTMQILGADRFIYRFEVEARDRSVVKIWEIPVPFDRLTNNSLDRAYADFTFDKHGHIEWLADNSAVRFFVRGVEVSRYEIPKPIARVGPSAGGVVPHSADEVLDAVK